MNKRPLILISNDDGYSAPGITSLIEMLKPYGNLVVVAPEGMMSGKSSSLTSEEILRVRKVSSEEGCEVYACNGTPTDCMKIALDKILSQKPDYIFTGINLGANSSTSVLYSGTVGAAIEGVMHNIPSVALSQCTHDPNADFMQHDKWIAKLFKFLENNKLPELSLLNVNIPACEVKGIKVCRQAFGIWEKEMEQRTDPRGGTYYWLTGNFVNKEPEAQDTDLWALNNGYISIVPTTIDMTNHEAIQSIKNWEF